MNSCEACGDECHELAYCCRRCKKLIDRIDLRSKPNKSARRKALQLAWDGECFRCYYTGWPLQTEHGSPYSLQWEHKTPGDEDDIVAAAAIINDMKTDLTEEEFRALVIALADKFRGATDAVPMIDPKQYRR